MKNFKSDNQLTIELLERNNVKEIKENLLFIYSKTDYAIKDYQSDTLTNIENIGDTLLELVQENSNDFTKDIAEKCKKNEWNLSEKQAWCVAYQIHNNIETYKIGMYKYNEECLSIDDVNKI